MAARTCKGGKQDGTACGAPPLRDGDFCLMHDPEQADVVAEARRTGGLRRKREATVAVAYDFEGLDTVEQIRRLLLIAATDALALENSIARVRALTYLGQSAMSLLKAGELEDDVKEILTILKPREQRGKGRR